MSDSQFEFIICVLELNKLDDTSILRTEYKLSAINFPGFPTSPDQDSEDPVRDPDES